MPYLIAPTAKRINLKIALDLRTKQVGEQANQTMEAVAKEWADEVKAEAQVNVTPGRGPGPHPHRTPHYDSGTLRDNLKTRQSRRGGVHYAEVYTDDPVGAYLEWGFTAPSGVFYRYPWLYPAFVKKADDVEGWAVKWARMYLTDTGYPRKGLVPMWSF